MLTCDNIYSISKLLYLFVDGKTYIWPNLIYMEKCFLLKDKGKKNIKRKTRQQSMSVSVKPRRDLFVNFPTMLNGGFGFGVVDQRDWGTEWPPLEDSPQLKYGLLQPYFLMGKSLGTYQDHKSYMPECKDFFRLLRQSRVGD